MVAIAGVMALLIMLLSGLGIVLAAVLGIAIYHNHKKRKKEHGKLWVRISLWFVLALGIVIIAFPILFFGMMMLEDREQEAKEVEKKQKVEEEASVRDEEMNTMSMFIGNTGYRLIVADAAAGSRFYQFEKSTDGGMNWITVNENPFDDSAGKAEGIVFFSENYGYIGLAGASEEYSSIYVTHDGGNCFSKIELPMNLLKTVPIQAAQNGYTAADFDYAKLPYEENGRFFIEVTINSTETEEIVFVSEDNGVTWSLFEEGASQWVEGFEIPLTPEEEQEAQEELYDILAIIGDDFLSYHEKDSYNTEIPEDKLEEKVKILAENGYTVKTEYVYSNIENWEPLDAFLKHAEQGEKDKVLIIRLRTSGLIVREEYVFDGNDMYVISAGVCINTEGAYIQSYRNKSRLKSWSYTEEGWFRYELCVPEYPLVTETVVDSVLLRVKPISEDNRIASEKYVYGLGYKGNNILCTSWDTETVENLDFTGIYEYLYAMEYGKRFELSDAAEGIQKDAFESLLMKYLPVSSQQIRESTEFDEENNVYPWMHLGCGNYAPDSFGTSYPEVIDIKKHADGTMTLTIHAVCESLLSEAVIVHKLTIEENADGSFKYLKNEILYPGENEIPAYQYRIK